MSISIRRAESQDIQKIVSYVCDFRKHLFPMIDHTEVPRDLKSFQETYLDHPYGMFIMLENEKNDLIGTVGMMAYNHRFKHFDISVHPVSEVVKLYVAPAYRRQGWGQKLYSFLEKEAAFQKVNHLYLHTHPFLPGAEKFWKQQEFVTIIQDSTPVFETIHMYKKLIG